MNPKVIRILIDKFHFEQQKENAEEVGVGTASLSFDTPEEVNDFFGEEDKYIYFLQVSLEITFVEESYKSESHLTGSYALTQEDYERFEKIVSEFSKDSQKVREELTTILKPLMDKFRVYTSLFSEEALNYMEVPEISFEAQ